MPRVAEAVIVNPRALSPYPRSPSAVLVQSSPSNCRSHLTSARTDIYADKKLGVIKNPAQSEATPSARTPYLERSVHYCSLSETKYVESLMREILLACSVLNCRAPKMVLDLAKMLRRWLRELLRENRVLQGRHAVSKQEVKRV